MERRLKIHSFKRREAQYTMGEPQIGAQWIFDRGVRILKATNESYLSRVINIDIEDHKNARSKYLGCKR